MGFFRKKAAGYKAGVRVERYRSAAVELRERDPTTYAQVLARADGSEAEGAARRDPDAYIALFLAAWDDEAGTPGTSEPVAERDIDHWPSLNVDATWGQVTEVFHGAIADRDATQLYFPGWFVRRLVTLAVMDEAGPIRPDVAEEFALLIGVADGADPMREDPGLDEKVDAFLSRRRLSQIVAALVEGLSTDDDA
jgi:hypothetical protein